MKGWALLASLLLAACANQTDDGDDDTECTPGAINVCMCGARMGTRTCTVDGRFTACMCPNTDTGIHPDATTDEDGGADAGEEDAAPMDAEPMDADPIDADPIDGDTPEGGTEPDAEPEP